MNATPAAISHGSHNAMPTAATEPDNATMIGHQLCGLKNPSSPAPSLISAPS
ncbi:Uncharacterised protein [Mycobacterium tuberculosis]|uniref:Uncharacterized protein n=1 Tax=Mycobacterium tuberculosis TaxID=1773 RepID=A0A916LEH3_MYCTX|nr:Uncharacterised protein [Mycobacterium tuberculosis]